MKLPVTRFREIAITKLYGAQDLLEKAVFIITYGRGAKEKPIAISIPYVIYEKIPQISELVTLLANYSELLSALRRNKYFGKDERQVLLDMIKDSKVNLQALEQVLVNDIGRAINTLEN